MKLLSDSQTAQVRNVKIILMAEIELWPDKKNPAIQVKCYMKWFSVSLYKSVSVSELEMWTLDLPLVFKTLLSKCAPEPFHWNLLLLRELLVPRYHASDRKRRPVHYRDYFYSLVGIWLGWFLRGKILKKVTLIPFFSSISHKSLLLALCFPEIRCSYLILPGPIFMPFPPCFMLPSINTRGDLMMKPVLNEMMEVELKP